MIDNSMMTMPQMSSAVASRESKEFEIKESRFDGAVKR